MPTETWIEYIKLHTYQLKKQTFIFKKEISECIGKVCEKASSLVILLNTLEILSCIISNCFISDLIGMGIIFIALYYSRTLVYSILVGVNSFQNWNS